MEDLLDRWFMGATQGRAQGIEIVGHRLLIGNYIVAERFGSRFVLNCKIGGRAYDSMRDLMARIAARLDREDVILVEEGGSYEGLAPLVMSGKGITDFDSILWSYRDGPYVVLYRSKNICEYIANGERKAHYFFGGIPSTDYELITFKDDDAPLEVWQPESFRSKRRGYPDEESVVENDTMQKLDNSLGEEDCTLARIKKLRASWERLSFRNKNDSNHRDVVNFEMDDSLREEDMRNDRGRWPIISLSWAANFPLACEMSYTYGARNTIGLKMQGDDLFTYDTPVALVDIDALTRRRLIRRGVESVGDCVIGRRARGKIVEELSAHALSTVNYMHDPYYDLIVEQTNNAWLTFDVLGNLRCLETPLDASMLSHSTARRLRSKGYTSIESLRELDHKTALQIGLNNLTYLALLDSYYLWLKWRRKLWKQRMTTYPPATRESLEGVRLACLDLVDHGYLLCLPLYRMVMPRYVCIVAGTDERSDVYEEIAREYVIQCTYDR